MSDVAWVSLGANIAVVIIMILSVVQVRRQQKQSDAAARRQQKQSEKDMLQQIRYGLEGHVTQIRTTGAQLIGGGPGYKKLEEREKEYKTTIKELAERIAKLEEEL